jgi:nitroimidazol reductase NimA-like FMN-containing flavoprotein (pyridoxamine 5'-phosphate oxidase superfamily)
MSKNSTAMPTPDAVADNGYGTTMEEKAAGRRTPRSLAPDEVEAVLARNWWGVLATSVGGRPYAVPVAYGYDGSALFIATGAGQKLDHVLQNPAVCFTITEVDDGSRWRSVVLTGEATTIPKLGARLAAFDVLRRQVAGRRKSTPRDVGKLASASVVRILPDARSGRACGD